VGRKACLPCLIRSSPKVTVLDFMPSLSSETIACSMDGKIEATNTILQILTSLMDASLARVVLARRLPRSGIRLASTETAGVNTNENVDRASMKDINLVSGSVDHIKGLAPTSILTVLRDENCRGYSQLDDNLSRFSCSLSKSHCRHKMKKTDRFRTLSICE
jgi:hypothetical protein